MKRLTAILLSVLTALTVLSVGVFGVADRLAEKRDKEALSRYYAATQTFDGAVSDRLIVRSTRAVDKLDAVQSADGWRGRTYLQFDSRESAEKAYRYYASLDCVTSVEYDGELTCDSENVMSPKCYATVNSNLDDAAKYVQVRYPDAPDVEIAVVDVKAENSDLLGDRLIGGFDDIGTIEKTMQKHASMIAGTIYYNTPENVKIHSYPAGITGISSEQAGAGIMQAINDGCRIINMSFSSTTSFTPIREAIEAANEAGAVLVSSAGNTGEDIGVTKRYPACYDGVLPVGNMTESRITNSGSCYGDPVYTYMGGTNVRSYFRGEEITWNGTSASSPLLCCVVADMLSVQPNLTRDEIADIILQTAVPSNEQNLYRNIPDAYAAVTQVGGQPLARCDLSYELTRDNSTGNYRLLLDSQDADCDIFYEKSSSPFKFPIALSVASSCFAYTKGSVLSLRSGEVIRAVAYVDGKAKSDWLTVAYPRSIDSVTGLEVASFAFAGNDELDTLILPDSVKIVNRYAFTNCHNLKKVIMPNVTNICMFAFRDCPELREVIAPKQFSPCTGAFYNCPKLELVQVKYTNASLIDKTRCFMGDPLVMSRAADTNVYRFDHFDGADAVYCGSQGGEMTKSVDDVLFLWHDWFLINRIQNDAYYQQYLCYEDMLFDINLDGIVNAKDYALLLQHTGE